MSVLSGDIARGYDFAQTQINPLPVYLNENYNKVACLSIDARIERLLEMTKTDPSMLFKAGIAQFIDYWWKQKESELRLRPSFPSCRNMCEQCSLEVPWDDEAKKEHMDSHFRIKTLQAYLSKELDFSTTQKLEAPIREPNERRRVVLHEMLKLDIKPATRMRLETELFPERQAKAKLAASLGIFNKNTSLEISRGWMMPATKWVSISTANVPQDVISYGTFVLRNNQGFWRQVFANLKEIPKHWIPWIQSGDAEILTNLQSIDVGAVKKLLPIKTHGSKAFMQSLSNETRNALVRAEDKYDERLCALCGEGFKIVLSEDPNDEFKEDLVFLDAVPHPMKKIADSGGILHYTCFMQIAETRENSKKAKKLVLTHNKKRKTSV